MGHRWGYGDGGSTASSKWRANTCGWNDTIIFFIPKVKESELVTDLEPISLFNVLYKVVSKLNFFLTE